MSAHNAIEKKHCHVTLYRAIKGLVDNIYVLSLANMARKKKKKFFEEEGRAVAEKMLSPEVIHTISAISFFVLGIFFILSAFGKSGIVGIKTHDWLSLLFGIGYFLLPLLSFVLSVSFIRDGRPSFPILKIAASLFFFFSGLGLIEIFFSTHGGWIGALLARPLVHFFDIPASVIILGALFLISLLIILNTHIALPSFMRKKDVEDEELEEEDLSIALPDVEEDNKNELVEPPHVSRNIQGTTTETEHLDGPPIIAITKYRGMSYAPPPLSLLERDHGKPGVGDIKANANIIKRTFQNFGIDVEMDEISVGPSVTRYAMKPAEGVLLTKILGLQRNLELALAAHPVRIEAPIPGKSLVGIEIPNAAKTTVGLGSMLSNDEYVNSTKPLPFSLGKDVTGRGYFSDLTKMPHLLIAGATGSGKSVTIHCVINSFIFKHSPENLKFVMVDPKRVELTLYNGTPHLLTPVITDPKKAILALKWLINEMSRRYDVLESHAVRDIHSYHLNVLARATKDADVETMPYIIVVIDELADIMSSYPRELEAAIVRLAQMSRAVGIHLILSTQRPSVDIITGLIKANIPGRIALQVSSQVDSRTILDMSGAEKLLGAGDMLFLSGEMGKPVRLQSPFITEEEVKAVVTYLKKHYEGDAGSDLEMAIASGESERGGAHSSTFDDDIDDDLYEDARTAVMDAGKASTSYIQRKLRIGYSRAARLMDILEERKVIGPADGSRPRAVLAREKSDASEENQSDMNGLSEL